MWTRARFSLRCGSPPTCPRGRASDLLLALPRPKVMRRLWAQLAALGVGRIMLTNAERVERNTSIPTCSRPMLPAAAGRRAAAGRGHPPAAGVDPQAVQGARRRRAGRLFASGARIVAHPGAGTDRACTGAARTARVASCWPSDPEGGWNAFELGLLQAHGFQAVGMGPRTLRTDTACIALVSLVNEMEREGCGAARGAGVPASGANGAGREAPALRQAQGVPSKVEGRD